MDVNSNSEIEPTVFIIESPSDIDVFEKRAEGFALFSALQLSGISSHYYNVASSETFDRCFEKIYFASRPFTRVVGGSVVEKKVPVPFIHVSAHGNETGIGFTNGDFITWQTLRNNLVSFSERLNLIGKKNDVCLLTLCMSVCKGAYAKEILEFGTPYAFTAMVGSDENVEWADALTAYVTFYHLAIYKDLLAHEAVLRMNQAAGTDNLFYATTFKDV